MKKNQLVQKCDTNQVAIDFKKIKFSYGATPILDLQSFLVHTGEIIFLYGPSGSGKSTLLELIAGVLQVQSGELFVLGHSFHQKSLAELDQFRAEHIGYIFQSFNLIPYLSVRENLILPLMFFKKRDQAEHQDASLNNRLEKLIYGLGLELFIDRSVSELSVGQQQRVAVARALLKKPKIILADEPTSALDYDHRESFLKLLFQFCREEQTTVLFVSHDRSIEKLFDRSISLSALNAVTTYSKAQI